VRLNGEHICLYTLSRKYLDDIDLSFRQCLLYLEDASLKLAKFSETDSDKRQPKPLHCSALPWPTSGKGLGGWVR
jgi:hypothetical protein